MITAMESATNAKNRNRKRIMAALQCVEPVSSRKKMLRWSNLRNRHTRS